MVRRHVLRLLQRLRRRALCVVSRCINRLLQHQHPPPAAPRPSPMRLPGPQREIKTRWQSQLGPGPPNPTSRPLGARRRRPQARCERASAILAPRRHARANGAQRPPITDCLLTLCPSLSRAAGTRFPAQRCGHFTSTPACLQKPWDGPALLVFSDGSRVGCFRLDATDCGLPATGITTREKWPWVIGFGKPVVVAIEESRIIERVRLGPAPDSGRRPGKRSLAEELAGQGEVAARHPPLKWGVARLASGATPAAFRPSPGKTPSPNGELDLPSTKTASAHAESRSGDRRNGRSGQ